MREPMRVAAFMSGSGSTVRKLIEGQQSYIIACIFSDNNSSKAQEIGKEFGIAVRIDDLSAFCAARGVPRSDMSTRELFDTSTAAWLKEHQVDCIALAGYMSLVTAPLIDKYPIFNSHPADLTILDSAGKRKFVGAHAVKDAIDADEEQMRTCIIQVNNGVDEGPILVRSPAVKVNGRSADLVQEELKHKGDYPAYIFALRELAAGNLTLNPVKYSGVPQPKGVMMEKVLLRNDMQARRDALPKSVRDDLSLKIAQRAFMNPKILAAKRVMSYVPIGNEVDTSYFKGKKHIALPAIEHGKPIALEDTGSYESKNGFPEPVPRNIVSFDDIDTVIVPAVAFDAQGNRLGRGLGFYDKLLPLMRAKRIGLAFEEQLVKSVPREAHDAKMDFIVTQDRVIPC